MRVLNLTVGGDLVIRSKGLVHCLRILASEEFSMSTSISIREAVKTDIELRASAPPSIASEDDADLREVTEVLILQGKGKTPELTDLVLPLADIHNMRITAESNNIEVSFIGGGHEVVPVGITVKVYMTFYGLPITYNEFIMQNVRGQ